LSPNTLVLFDIDGTLLTGGPAKGAFQEALVETFGTAGPISGWEFSGKTDPQIARELLTEAGIAKDRIDAGFAELWSRYLGKMAERLPASPPRQLPGAVALLDALKEERGAGIGLVTGNVFDGARLKLESGGFGADRFAVGAFGSDHEVRNELPPIAILRARNHWGVEFRGVEVVIVWDTPRDVDCGKRSGTRTVAVATGNFDSDSLAECGADVVFEDFTATDRVIDAILGR
jgi:phosphoglycolate phosphatase-like HAD superfamily hydrolase